MDSLLNDIRLLLDALTARAHECVPGSRLVTLDLQPLAECQNEGVAQLSLRLLKTSGRACFLQGTLVRDGVPVLKARALFRKT